MSQGAQRKLSLADYLIDDEEVEAKVGDEKGVAGDLAGDFDVGDLGSERFGVDDLDEPAGEILRLEIDVRDAETIAELLERPAGSRRQAFAEQALRIGVLALRHARGRIDADAVRRESQAMLETMRERMDEHARVVNDRLTSSLRDYFDPEHGSFQQRISALVRRDGDLEQLLRRQIDGEDSSLVKTLATHVGEQSPLFRMLSPEESSGVLAALRGTLDSELTKQRDRMLREFSLDNKEGALARLVEELAASHGKLGESLQLRINEVVREFSLDEEDSALSRLVRNVGEAQKTISQEFSLDNESSAFSRLTHLLKRTEGAIHDRLTLDDEASPLARLRRELLELIEKQSTTSRDFQEEVKISLGKLAARREEADRGTRHGVEFEDALCELLERDAGRQGDLLQRTGAIPGAKARKHGDAVWQMGPDSAGAGGRIVFEAKEDRSYDLAKAQAEIAEARANREASVGVFVFSAKAAPAGMEPMARIGADVFAVWDPEDSASDVFLRAACMSAKMMCVRAQTQTNEHSKDVQAMMKSVVEIERQTELLSEIDRSCETIRKSGEKISERVRKSRNALERHVETLRSRLEGLRDEVAAE